MEALQVLDRRCAAEVEQIASDADESSLVALAGSDVSQRVLGTDSLTKSGSSGLGAL